MQQSKAVLRELTTSWAANKGRALNTMHLLTEICMVDRQAIMARRVRRAIRVLTGLFEYIGAKVLVGDATGRALRSIECID